jgi:SAM-dependent methyltransferase
MPMQDFLRKTMQAAGRLVEGLAGRFQKNPSSRAVSVDGKVEKTTEIALPEMRVRKVLESMEGREAAALVPNLSGKKALHATASAVRQWETLKQRGAQMIVDFDVGPLYGPPPPSTGKPPNLHLAKGSFLAAPFPDESFEFLLLLAAGAKNENTLSWLGEMARILKDGSRVVISYIHPYFEHLNNPRAGFSHGIDGYYMSLRKAGIYVEEIKEVKADDAVRSLFGPTKDDKEFALIKGYPMVVFFKAIRLRRR